MSETLVPHPDAGRIAEWFCARHADTYGPRSSIGLPLLMPALIVAVIGGVTSPAFLFEGHRLTGMLVAWLTIVVVAALAWTFYRICYRRSVVIESGLYPVEREAALAVKTWAALRDPSLRLQARPIYEAFYREALAYSIDERRERRQTMKALAPLLAQFGTQQSVIDVRRAEAKANKRLAGLPAPSGTDAVADAKAYLAALDELNRLGSPTPGASS